MYLVSSYYLRCKLFQLVLVATLTSLPILLIAQQMCGNLIGKISNHRRLFYRLVLVKLENRSAKAVGCYVLLSSNLFETDVKHPELLCLSEVDVFVGIRVQESLQRFLVTKHGRDLLYLQLIFELYSSAKNYQQFPLVGIVISLGLRKPKRIILERPLFPILDLGNNYPSTPSGRVRIHPAQQFRVISEHCCCRIIQSLQEVEGQVLYRSLDKLLLSGKYSKGERYLGEILNLAFRSLDGTKELANIFLRLGCRLLLDPSQGVFFNHYSAPQIVLSTEYEDFCYKQPDLFRRELYLYLQQSRQDVYLKVVVSFNKDAVVGNAISYYAEAIIYKYGTMLYVRSFAAVHQ